MDTVKNKLLLISYAFPPDAAVGAQRAGSFAKYLPGFGLSTHTVTIRLEHIEKIDEAMNLALQRFGVIHRTKCLANPMGLLSRIKRVFVSRRQDVIPTVSNQTAPVLESGGGTLKKFIYTVLATPDEFLGWVPYAVRTSINLLKSENIRIMLSSAPPFTCHIVALIVKLIRPRTVWIADFRDPLLSNEWMTIDKSYWLTKSMNGFLERVILKYADKVLCVNEAIASDLIQRYLGRYDTKITVLPNGFDAEEFDSVTVSKKHSDKLIVSYIGNLYGNRDGRPLMSALRDLFVKCQYLKGRVLIRFVGIQSPDVNSLLVNEASLLGLTDAIEVVGHVSRVDAICLMKRSDVLFLTQPDAPLQVPLKLYEYLACGKPILAIAGDGATRNLIEENNAGIVVYPDDAGGLLEALMELLVKRDRKDISPDVALKFERCNTASRLADLLTGMNS
jgi:glycosyltransferase involved in cell wall biosynthesis